MKGMALEGKYARVEWERRFLLDGFPKDVTVTRVRRIRDRYIEGTTLRLREQADEGGEVQFKLTQKIGAGKSGARQGVITTMYLTKDEFVVLAALCDPGGPLSGISASKAFDRRDREEMPLRTQRVPARILTKTRYSVPPLGIDVFEGTLSGLVMAEAEFSSGAEAEALALPSFIVHSHEVTDDPRFTGGCLVTASRQELEGWLSDHGLRVNPSR